MDTSQKIFIGYLIALVLIGVGGITAGLLIDRVWLPLSTLTESPDNSPKPKTITRASLVKEMVSEGWELWHIATDPLPGRWGLARGHERVAVAWAAITGIRQRYLPWFEQHTQEVQQGRYTWFYRYRQPSLQGLR